MYVCPFQIGQLLVPGVRQLASQLFWASSLTNSAELFAQINIGSPALTFELIGAF
jgi:hypothetical protein